MVWYQRFEYAIGHWLQKATEHMIGCVMCCPGCFSLFRAKTLMDDNVMRRYAVKAEGKKLTHQAGLFNPPTIEEEGLFSTRFERSVKEFVIRLWTRNFGFMFRNVLVPVQVLPVVVPRLCKS